jgi:UDP-3-O-[3-hydroxymyristoyl] glucosamine N-acyltransferase
MTELPPTIDGSAEIASTAIVDEYHPSLGSRVPPTVIEAGAVVGRFTIVYSSATIRKDASVGDHCVLEPNTVVHAGATLGGGCRMEDGAVVGDNNRERLNSHNP